MASSADSDRGAGDDMPNPVPKISSIPGATDLIDEATFDQIVEMDQLGDDEEDQNPDEPQEPFSKSLVYEFFEQATKTFEKMDEALKDNDLKTLSERGHYLKGSSATLGVIKVKDSCEKIQNFGAKRDATGAKNITEAEALRNLETSIEQAKQEFYQVEKVLKIYYKDES